MEQRELIRRVATGDKGARDELVMNNIGLIWSIVRRFSNRGYELEDLFQVGCIGLMKAIDKFDLSYDVKFSTYAVPMISGEIKRFLRDDGMIKVSRSLKEQAYRIQKAKEEFMNLHHREATLEEISTMICVPVDEIVVALESGREVESLNRTVYEGETHSLSYMDMIEAPVSWEENVMNQLMISELAKTLDDLENQIINYRYFKSKTQKETGNILGISQVQVSRIEKKALLKLRKKMGQAVD